MNLYKMMGLVAISLTASLTAYADPNYQAHCRIAESNQQTQQYETVVEDTQMVPVETCTMDDAHNHCSPHGVTITLTAMSKTGVEINAQAVITVTRTIQSIIPGRTFEDNNANITLRTKLPTKNLSMFTQSEPFFIDPTKLAAGKIVDVTEWIILTDSKPSDQFPITCELTKIDPPKQ